MTGKYPNIEILEKLFRSACDTIFSEPAPHILVPETEVEVFPQTWPDTSCGIGDGFAGQAFTKAYTSVFSLKWSTKQENKGITDSGNIIYGVFFRNTLAYVLINPNKKFQEDLKNHSLKEQKKAGIYVDIVA